MTKEKPFSDKVFVKRIPKKGYAVFATRPFRKGEVIVPMRGKILTRQQANKCSRYQQDHMYTIGKNKYLLCTYPDKYINHSCSPNVYENNRNIVALKKIKRGEELNFHYALNVLEDFWMKCHCHAKNCTGTLKGNFFRLSKREQKKFAPYLDKWFKKLFKKELKNLK